MNSFTNALGLDVGLARIGVARISAIAQIAEPLVVLKNDVFFVEKLRQLIAEHSVDLIVVGMPRNMKGEKTDQSAYVEEFVKELAEETGVSLQFQDETLSTVAAQERVTPKTKQLEDAYAAAVILEDFLASGGQSGKIN